MTEGGYREVLRRKYARTHLSAAGPAPDAASFDYYARVYAKTFGPWLPERRTAAIFELGCGTGSFLHYLRGQGYSAALGMDSDPGSIETARGLGVSNAELGDALERLAKSPGAYDAVVAIDVLEHFRKDELFSILAAIRSALRPDGLFLWRAPNAESLFHGRLRYGDLTHENVFTRHSAYQLMTAAGFSGVEIRGEGPVVTGASSLARAALWPLFKAAAKAYLYAESCETSAMLEPNLIVAARRAG